MTEKEQTHFGYETINSEEKEGRVADVFDALSHRRSYKKAWSPEQAFTEIEKGAGTQFDPEIVRAFLQVKSRISAILLAYPDEDSCPEERDA